MTVNAKLLEAAKDAEITRLRAENAGMREALQNASGLIDTPIARRRYAGDPFYTDVIKSIRAALSKASQAEGQTP